MVNDYYQVLNIEKDADVSEIKRAYREMALKYHPDINQTEDAEEIFKKINEAYSVLSDPDHRRQYDRYGTVNRRHVYEQQGQTASMTFGRCMGGRRGMGRGCGRMWIWQEVLRKR